QGKLYVAADPEVTSFDMYINDSKVDTSAFVGGKCYEVDFSKVSVNGRNSVQISNVMPFDYNKDTEELERVRVCIPYPTVIEGTPSEVGIADESLKLISDIIESDVENGFTSSQLAVIRQGKLVYQNAWGYTNSYLPDGSINPEKVPVTNDTLYDLASVTKMASVNLSIQKMVTDGTINLDDKIADYIGPEFYESVLDFGYKGKEYVSHETQVKWKSELTVRDILCHQAGFPADPMYHYIYLDASTYAASKNNTNILYSGVESNEDTKAKTLVSICKTPLMYEPGSKTVYSDVDYMLLGFLIEKVSGKDLNSYCKENFWEPMDLNNITFNPLKNGFDASDCAATELNGNTRDGVVDFPGIRNYTLQGEVHDEKAYYCMGGVSGHAGLFANATDLAKLMSTMLTGGYGEYSFYSENVIDAFTAPKDAFSASWGLGWWREGELQRVGFFGTDSGNSAFGHQGWTGTIVIIDPDKDLVIVYLTNKINSSLISKSSANRFRGGAYTAATLGFVPQILAIGMDGEGALGARLTSLTASMARESVRIIPDGAAGDNPYYANAKSKINVLKKWSDEYGAENETYYNDLINELNTELEERANN
ncbi:MAG: penicillin binding protein PBP4B, partial [Lachnospiraceae bacterium]|nr:penicillin binding protein PBP4B [Lachnospiraceae bacterium]